MQSTTINHSDVCGFLLVDPGIHLLLHRGCDELRIVSLQPLHYESVPMSSLVGYQCSSNLLLMNENNIDDGKEHVETRLQSLLIPSIMLNDTASRFRVDHPLRYISALIFAESLRVDHQLSNHRDFTSTMHSLLFDLDSFFFCSTGVPISV